MLVIAPSDATTPVAKLGHSITAAHDPEAGSIAAFGERTDKWFIAIGRIPDSALTLKELITLNADTFKLAIEGMGATAGFVRKPQRSATTSVVRRGPSFAYVPPALVRAADMQVGQVTLPRFYERLTDVVMGLNPTEDQLQLLDPMFAQLRALSTNAVVGQSRQASLVGVAIEGYRWGGNTVEDRIVRSTLVRHGVEVIPDNAPIVTDEDGGERRDTHAGHPTRRRPGTGRGRTADGKQCNARQPGQSGCNDGGGRHGAPP